MEYKHQHHEITEEGKQFLESLSPHEKELHEMARKMLGSSYFVEKTPHFLIWKAKQQLQKSNPNTQPQGAK